MEAESSVTRIIIEDIRSSNMKGDQMEGKSSVTGSIIDELNS